MRCVIIVHSVLLPHVRLLLLFCWWPCASSWLCFNVVGGVGVVEGV